jgi:CRISPR/Cas system endoribonuclease Cas6 (RAMP superfamily)
MRWESICVCVCVCVYIWKIIHDLQIIISSRVLYYISSCNSRNIHKYAHILLRDTYSLYMTYAIYVPRYTSCHV